MTGARIAAGGALIAGLMLAMAASGASAQAGSADARWQAWVGCWQSGGGAGSMLSSSGSQGRTVCVVPASGTSAVDLLTVDSGRIVSREHIDASGERRTADEGGCTGWRSAEWSSSGKRVYLHSEFTCANAVKRTSSGLFAMAPGDQWLRVRGVGAGDGAGVRVERYLPAAVPSVLAGELGPILERDSLELSAARTADQGPVSTADVIEASKRLDAPVVEAWLLERRPDVAVDAKQLETMADAGVPARVIDAMVALSYPRKFAIGATRDIALRNAAAAAATGYGSGIATQSVFLDPYGYWPYGLDYYSPYGFGYGYGYGGGWYPWSGPVIIVQNPNAAPHGKVVNGRGYRRGENGSGNEAGADAGAGSSARSSGASSAGRTSTGRTAKPRP